MSADIPEVESWYITGAMSGPISSTTLDAMAEAQRAYEASSRSLDDIHALGRALTAAGFTGVSVSVVERNGAAPMFDLTGYRTIISVAVRGQTP